ncbi:MAG: pyridoxamine 5'-phosphate oxidase family protein [Christensenellales bacterium]
MRRKDREVTKTEDILHIVDRASTLHLGLFDAEYPYVVPLHYGYEYADGSLVFFLHSAKEGHKLDLIRANPKVCVELEYDVQPISGGDVPCKYGSAFSSVIGRGYAEILGDGQEKIRDLSLLMKNRTGQAFGISDQMASAVEVIKVVVPEFTAKSRPKTQEQVPTCRDS